MRRGDAAVYLEPGAAPMQGLLFERDGWAPVLSGRKATARAVRPLLARVEAARRELGEAVIAVVGFHNENCPEGIAFADCDVCQGRL